jgi:hypothetical protein
MTKINHIGKTHDGYINYLNSGKHILRNVKEGLCFNNKRIGNLFRVIRCGLSGETQMFKIQKELRNIFTSRKSKKKEDILQV